MTDNAFALHHLFRAATRDADRAPLVLLLHGFMEDEATMHRLAPALDERFCVVSVRAPMPVRRGAAKYAWARVRFTPDGPEDDAADFETSRRAFLRFLDQLLPAYGLDPGRVYLMGFSQGASLTLGLVMSEAERFAGAVVMSGKLLDQYLPPSTMPNALVDFPVFLAHGVEDKLVPIRRARKDRDVLTELPVDVTCNEYRMGHEMGEESLRDVTRWVERLLEGGRAV